MKNSESDRTFAGFFVHNVCWVRDSVDTWWDCSGIRYNFESLNLKSDIVQIPGYPLGHFTDFAAKVNMDTKIHLLNMY